MPVRTYTPGFHPHIARLRTGRVIWMLRTTAVILSAESPTHHLHGARVRARTCLTSAIPVLEPVSGTSGSASAILRLQSGCECDSWRIALTMFAYRAP